MSRLKVLLVDDFQPIRRSMAAILGQHSFIERIAESDDGFDAVQQARSLQPDAVILDVSLPTLNGIEAARRIRQFCPSTRFVFLADPSSAASADEAFNSGASAFILKSDLHRRIIPVMQAIARGENVQEHHHPEPSMDATAGTPPHSQNGGFVLNSWKEIADYLGRGVRTAQRWEADLGMPVRRPRAKSRSAVLAMSDELDRWLRSAPIAEDCAPSSNGNGKHAAGFHYESFQEHCRLRDDCRALLTANRKALVSLIAAVQELSRSSKLAGQAPPPAAVAGNPTSLPAIANAND